MKRKIVVEHHLVLSQEEFLFVAGAVRELAAANRTPIALSVSEAFGIAPGELHAGPICISGSALDLLDPRIVEAGRIARQWSSSSPANQSSFIAMPERDEDPT